jgi:hypothetical protein
MHDPSGGGSRPRHDSREILGATTRYGPPQDTESCAPVCESSREAPLPGHGEDVPAVLGWWTAFQSHGRNARTHAACSSTASRSRTSRSGW